MVLFMLIEMMKVMVLLNVIEKTVSIGIRKLLNQTVKYYKNSGILSHYFYSLCIASIIFKFAALLAGKYPNTKPNEIENRIAAEI